MNAVATIRGFIAWCEEFVDQVLDHNESLMTVEFNEQIAILQTATEVVDLDIPDIKSDEALVRIIDELKYRLKPALRDKNNGIAFEFNDMLNMLIKSNGLDSDPHSFASMPKAQFPGLKIGLGKFNVNSLVEQVRVRELVLTLDGISIGVVGGYGHSISTPTLLHLNDILLARGAYVALDNVLDHESEEFGKWEKLTFVLHEVEDGSDVRTHLIKIPPDNGAFLSDETCIIHSVVAGIIHPDMLRDPHVQCLTTEDRDGNPCDPVCAHCGKAEAYCMGEKE